MSKADPATAGGGGASDQSPQSPDRLLANQWSRYRKALKRCQHDFSADTVHALRVEIRRTLSTLGLLQAIAPSKRIAPLRESLTDRLKSFSRLRDTQVQLGLIKASTGDEPARREFERSLRRRERRLIRRLARDVKATRTTRLTRHVKNVRRALVPLMTTASGARKAEAALRGAIDRAVAKSSAAYRKVDPTNADSIHRLRIACKTSRYMIDAFAEWRPIATARQRHAMQACQSCLGDIHDIDVLRLAVEKFLNKSGADPGALKPWREQLLRRRVQLVKRLMASGDRWMNFRLPPPIAADHPRQPVRPCNS